MSEVPPFPITPDNQQALEELCRLLRFSQGEFALILAVCNSSQQRQGLVAQLRQHCPIAFDEITLPPTTTTLFTTLRNSVGKANGDANPTALMVYGLDTIAGAGGGLNGNQPDPGRVSHIAVSLVLWLTDDGLKQLMRTAPDFYTWAHPVTFETPPEFFRTFLVGLIWDVWQQVLNSRESHFLSTQELGVSPGSSRSQELATSLAALAAQAIELTRPQTAALTFVQGRLADNNTVTAREHYEDSLAQWQGLISQHREEADAEQPPQSPHTGGLQADIPPQALAARNDATDWLDAIGEKPPQTSKKQRYQEAAGHVQFYLGLWWRNHAERDRPSFHSACQQACQYFAAVVHTFEALQRPALVAKYLNYWAEALHRLERWSDLESVATQAVTLHQQQENPFRVARAKGFLAEVALAQQDWATAQRHAETALASIQPAAVAAMLRDAAPDDVAFYAWVNSFHRSWYLFSLGRAQFEQGQIDAAVTTLEQVCHITQPDYDPQLYSRVLEQLRQGYFRQGKYLRAFETRWQKDAIESRFNYRPLWGRGGCSQSSKL